MVEMDTIYLAKNKEGKQLGLYISHIHAFGDNPEIHTCDIWKLDGDTGRFHLTNSSVGRLEVLQKK